MWCSIRIRIFFFKYSGQVVIQMNIIIFCRHAVTVASAGCVVFIFALLCPIHTDQESDNCKRNEFKEGLIFTTCHLSVMLRFFFGYAMSFILCHEWLKLSELQNLTPERQVFSYSDSWPVKMGPIRCPETSVNNYHTTPRNIPEERRSYQHRGGSLKLRFSRKMRDYIQTWKQVSTPFYLHMRS